MLPIQKASTTGSLQIMVGQAFSLPKPFFSSRVSKISKEY
jgi:hypothetical protein